MYDISISSDDKAVLPEFFCNSCYITAKNKDPADKVKRGKEEWLPQLSAEGCNICTAKKGRPKKRSFGGRPSGFELHIKSVSCSLPSTDVQVLDAHYRDDVCCVACKTVIVIEAVQIEPCKSLACQHCCIELVSNKEPFRCPGCLMTHECSAVTFQSVYPIIMKVIGDLLVKCLKCAKQVKLYTLNQDCCTHQSQFSQHVTLEDIIQLPLDVEPSGLEKRAATNLVSRLLYHQQDDTISLPRKGQVSWINNKYYKTKITLCIVIAN